MDELINTVDEIGEELLLTKIIDGSLSSFVSTHLRKIDVWALSNMDLEYINFPNVTQINGYGLANTKIKALNVDEVLPKVTSCGEGAFAYCYNLETLSFTRSNFANYYYMFKDCVSLISVTYLGNNTTYFGSSYNFTFQNAGRILNMPNVTSLKSGNAGCGYSRFEIVKLPSVTEFQVSTSSNCNPLYNTLFLKTLVIGSQDDNSVCTLTGSTDLAFYDSALITSSNKFYDESFVYVPDALVNQYKEATNWSTIADKIKPLSEFSETFANDPSYIQDSWATIKQNIDNDNYSQYLGKKKFLLVQGYGWCYMVCIKQDGDELADGTGNSKTTWFCEDCIGITRKMNPAMVSGTVGTGSIGGYANSKIKGVMDNIYEVLNAEDSELHNIITPVKKYTHVYNVDGTGSSTRNHDVESTEYVWLASYREMFGTSSTTYETKGVTYSDYFTKNASRIKYIYSGAYHWWLRSSYTNDYHFQMVSNSGNSNYNSANGSYGIAFGFCI